MKKHYLVQFGRKMTDLVRKRLNTEWISYFLSTVIDEEALCNHFYRYGARWILLKAFTFQTIKEISLVVVASWRCIAFRLCFSRLVLNPFYGVLLDNKGARKKKWLWHNLKEHVHAPPFQPITFMITKQLSIRCLSQVLVSRLLSVL